MLVAVKNRWGVVWICHEGRVIRIPTNKGFVESYTTLEDVLETRKDVVGCYV